MEQYYFNIVFTHQPHALSILHANIKKPLGCLLNSGHSELLEAKSNFRKAVELQVFLDRGEKEMFLSVGLKTVNARDLL